jgi:hypothetical protein
MAGHGHDNSGAKEKNDLEKEYQDLLKVSSSMIGGMQRQMDTYADSYANLTPVGKKHIDQLRDGIDGLSDQKSIITQINKYKKERNFLEGKYKQTGFGIYSDLSSQMKLQIDTLNVLNQRIAAIKAVGDVADTAAESINGMIDGFEHHLKDIPLLGGMISKIAEGPIHELKHAVTQSANQFKVSFGKALSEGKTGFQALKIAGGDAFGSFLASINPLHLAIAAIALTLAAGFARYHELEAAATEFKVQTGLAGVNLHDIESTIHHAQMGMIDIGVTASEMSKAMSDFTNEFSDLSIPAESTAMSVAMMAKQFGVFGNEIAGVNKLFQNMGGLSEQQAQYLAGSVVEMANLAAVAPDTVIKDLSQNSKEVMMYNRGSVKEIAKMAVNAAKLGTSMKETASVSEKLLDFEDSITKELELSALVGKDLNFARARELAFAGDTLGAQQEMVKQLDQMGDLSQLDAITKKQIEETTGMELDSLVNQQRIRKQFGTLGKDQLAAANALLDKGIDINDVSEADLVAQTKRMKQQESMADAMAKIGNKLSAIGVAFSDMFAPLGAFLVNVLGGIVNVLSNTIVPIFKALGKVIYYAFWPINNIGATFKALIGFVKEYYDYIIAAGIGAGIILYYSKQEEIVQMRTNAAKFIGTQLSKEGWLYKTYETVATWATTTAQGAYNAVLGIAKGIKEKGLMVSIADMATTAYASVAKIPYIGPILGAIAAAGAYALGKSYFSKAGDVMSPADGKTRVSTKEGGLFELSPNDDLIAAPGAADAMAGGVSGNASAGGSGAIAGLVNSMITEIRGLRTDLASGKVAVYMDGRLVTAQVASTAAKNPVTS